MLEPYARILDQLSPYLVATSDLVARLDVAPLGVEVAEANRVDPTKAASGPFLDLVERLDVLTFGPAGLGMPRWALYDCGELPGLVFGLGMPAENLRRRVRRALEVPDEYAGLVPLSMFICIPMLGEDRWHGHTVCSINEVSPGVTQPCVGLLSVALALTSLRARKLRCSTLWASPKLEVFSHYAPARLQASLLPAHTDAATCVFDVEVSPERVAASLASEPVTPTAERWLDIHDEAALEALQAEIEAGEPWCLMGPPVARGPLVRVPLAKVEQSR